MPAKIQTPFELRMLHSVFFDVTMENINIY